MVFGLFTEFLAASTRVLRINELLFRDLIFGLVYSVASFSIVFYNKTSNSKYLITAFLPVFLLEMWVGFFLFLENGGYSVVSHALPIILGVSAGRFFGDRMARYVSSFA